MKIIRFEDIEAWQEARQLCNHIYQLSNGSEFRRDFGLRDQIQRASVSIMANIAEGFESQSDSEFVKFLVYSRRSNTEIQSHLYVALDQHYITLKEFEEVLRQSHKVNNLVGGFIRYLRSQFVGSLGHSSIRRSSSDRLTVRPSDSPTV